MGHLSARAILTAYCAFQFLGWAHPGVAQTAPPCRPNTSPPMMQITIINNTNSDPGTQTTIYPVLSAGSAVKPGDPPIEDEWLEACSGSTQKQIDAGDKYPRAAIYRFYVNPTNGIA